MKILLDTHVFLWWITADARLSEKAFSLIKERENLIYISAASCWEIAIKSRLGKLHLPGANIDIIVEEIGANGFTPLAITVNHAIQVYKLPDYHRDPFDRILVAQARWEKVVLVTDDPLIRAYDVETVW